MVSVLTQIDVHETASAFVLVGHEGRRRRILRVHRRAGACNQENAAMPPV